VFIHILAIPILKKHVELILARYEEQPPELAALFTADQTRKMLGDVVSKGIMHLSQVCVVSKAEAAW
jgi:hypothetical protein